ncbi:MAG TPA: von Willebrand factor type A domain-containing protein [Vicinamibacterales bacterium]|nr:von Willebrand factor type A domain-containing protein [Vicinamibacterales bacterium]
MTRINPNDPKWTAYVLGELDKAESEAVERLLESSDEARALVEDLKAASVALAEAFDEAPADVLTAAQRASIRQAADAPRAGWFAMLPMRWAVGLASAAVIAIAVSVAVRMPQSAPQIGRVAEKPAPPAVPNPRATALPVPSTGKSTPVQASAPAPAPAGNIVPEAAGAAATAPVESVTVVGEAPVVDTQSARQSVRTLDNILPLTPAPAAAPAPAPAAVGGRGGGGRSGGPVFRGGTDAQNQGRVMVDGQAVGIGGGVAGGVPGGVPGGVVGGIPGSVPAGVPGRVLPPAGWTAPLSGGVSDSLTRVRPNTANESYARTGENAFVRASQEPLATFSIDVDTASFSNIRRFLDQNQMPPQDAVRIEEMVNYFTYDYPNPSAGRPIGVSMAVTTAPWNSRHRLVRFGVKAREIDRGRRPASNLVFLIDVSGSMNEPQKLPLVKSGLKLLVDQLGENDSVSIVVYASATGLVLPPTRGDRKEVIARAIDNLQAGGSTNGGAGIQLAYAQATANFIRGGANRVILMTDGDFNVGITSQSDLTRLIEDRARSGVFLSVLGFGMGNLKDSTMERLADTGNGHYAYIDTLNEARKVLVEEMSGTLVTVAKDVKIQVDFNPGKVEAYRLIGYENRVLRAEDFNNDLKDAGDMGAGHTVTALFEIVPRGGTVPGPSIDPSVFQPQSGSAGRSESAGRSTAPASNGSANSDDLLVLRLRYKLPDAAESTRMDVPLADRAVAFQRADPDVRFAAAVAAFGMILKDSSYKGDATLEWVLDTASGSVGRDRGGYRDEFVSLVRKAIALSDRSRFGR